MPALWTTLANLLVMLCLVVYQAPQPCRGDAAGHACTMASCACVAACTCRIAHQQARDLASVLAGRPNCCRSDREVEHAAEAAVAAAMSCHAGEAPTHFSLPGHHGPMVIAGAAPTVWPSAPAARHRGPRARRATGPPASPARPPWRLA